MNDPNGLERKVDQVQVVQDKTSKQRRKEIFQFFLLLLSVFCLGKINAQEASREFLNIEKITEEYSVGYTSFDEEFDGYGELWILSQRDTLPINDIEANNCHLWDVSPNGRFATFETLSIGWVYPTETDSILHDHWSGAIVDLYSARVVKYFRDDYGETWDSHNLWLQNRNIVFNGNDTIQHVGETVYKRSKESSRVSWITYYETGEVKETGQSDAPFGCGMNVGTHNFYHKDGTLSKSVSYDNWMPKNAEGCHESIQDKYILEFAQPHSRVKSRTMFQSTYEGEDFKTGIWQKFDDDGKIISSIDYGSQFNRLKLQEAPVERWHPEISEVELFNASDTLQFVMDSVGWQSESLTDVNLEKLDYLLERIEHHQLSLKPSLKGRSQEVLGELRFVASGKEYRYKLTKQNDHTADVVCFDGDCYRYTKPGFVGVLLTPFVANLDRWNWESPFFASGLEEIQQIELQSEQFPDTVSSSEEYIEAFKKLKWRKHISEPDAFRVGDLFGELTVTHDDGVQVYHLFERRMEGLSGTKKDPDNFFIKTGEGWFAASYYCFGAFLVHQK